MGPTAVGKTAVGIAVCEELKGEIISADSRQIYRGMTIGTAKSSPGELALVRHHLLDILNPDQVFSAGEFVRCAAQAAQDIKSRGKLPIVVGGAGLYIKALTDGIFEGESRDPALREKLEREYDSGAAEAMFKRLRSLDPQYADIVHLNDRKKLVRALEIIQTAGMPISELGRVQRPGPFEGLFCGLNMPRQRLYDRIEDRAERMIEAGLVEEVKALRNQSYQRDLNSLNSPGYSEIYDYLEGKLSLEEAAALIKRNTRRYAKRQMTWFRRDSRIKWFEAAEDLQRTAEEIIIHIKIELSL